jgi:DNA-binding transcriptional regulator YiaG
MHVTPAALPSSRLTFPKVPTSVILPNAEDYRPDPNYLRKLYEASGLSQKQYAVRLGVKDRTFLYWLSGTRQFPYTAQFAMEQLAKRKSR